MFRTGGDSGWRDARFYETPPAKRPPDRGRGTRIPARPRMTTEALLGLASVLLFGTLAQWVGWRLQLPAILLLLLSGVVAGPAGLGLVDPERLLGEFLTPFVSFSVALLLFEGGLTLSFARLRGSLRVVVRLVTIGALITWILAAGAARHILGLPLPLAILLGSILVVTGPTVVIPILRQVRPAGAVGNILKWEGILVDSVGAVLASLVFEAISDRSGSSSVAGPALLGIARTALLGTAFGALGAGLVYECFKRYWVPDHLQNMFALAVALGSFAASNALQHESGLLAVTLMGVLLANQKRVRLGHILVFKENLAILLVSVLFVLLAARLRLDDLAALGWRPLAFLAALVIVVRPASVWPCTSGAGLSRGERAYVALLAPRGVVAASVASIFALRMRERGIEGGERLVSVMFATIVGTVAFYGLAAGPLAWKLGLARRRPQGVLLVGANAWARDFARALREAGLSVRLVDTNPEHVAAAIAEGLPAECQDVLAEDSSDTLDLRDMGRLVAMTRNDEVNALAALHFLHVFGRADVYQLASDRLGAPSTLPADLRGRILASEGFTFREIEARWAAGARFAARSGDAASAEGAVPLVAVDGAGNATFATLNRPLRPQPGQTVVGLYPA